MWKEILMRIKKEELCGRKGILKEIEREGRIV